jgi:hypothetical protein
MHQEFHAAIVAANVQHLENRIVRDAWADTAVVLKDGPIVYLSIRSAGITPYEYRVRIDMTKFPVEPYWVGFIDPGLPQERWPLTSDTDPRYWPWSPMAGLHGSFILAFQGPYRTFWCRDCTVPFFAYHGDKRWDPAAWPLDRVVAHLREAIAQAEPPARWRPVQQGGLLQAAANAGVNVPPDAGLGAK